MWEEQRSRHPEMVDGQTIAPYDQGIFLLHRNKGKEHFQKQQLDDAARELEAASRIVQDDDQVLNLLGMVYFRQNKLEEAKSVYNQLLQRNPNVYSLHSNLGLIHLKQSAYDRAEVHFVEAARIEPTNVKARMYLGLIYERQRKYMQALEEYRRANNEKMAAQMEALLARYAERGEPLPAPVESAASSGEAPLPARPAPPRAILPAPDSSSAEPAHPPAVLPEPAADQSARRGETAAPKPPPVITSHVKETDFFNPQKMGEAEEQLERALDTAFGGVAPAVERPVQAAAEERQAVRPVEEEVPAAAAPAPPSPLPLNLGVLTQPSQSHLKCVDEDYRIVAKSFLEVVFESGLIMSAQRLVSLFALSAPEPIPEVDGLVQCAGAGRAVFFEDQYRIHLLRLTGEFLYVRPGCVLAMQPALRVQCEESSLFRFLRVEGDGIVALAVSTSPYVADVAPDTPLMVDASYVAALSATDLVRLDPAKRPGFVEINGRGTVLLLPPTRI